MTSAIDQLGDALWGACVIQHAAPDDDAMERWQTDELSHLRERFIVRPMPDALDDLVRRALADWQGREQKLCAALEMPPRAVSERLRTAQGGFPRRRTALANGSAGDVARRPRGRAQHGLGQSLLLDTADCRS
jgi:hypothetical protein